MKRALMAFLALVILVAGMGFSAQPAQAANCVAWHTVRWGETLSWIGRYYGVSWPTLAQVNGIANPRWIYAGQVLCIPAGGWTGGTGGIPPANNMRTWSFAVTAVDPKTSVTIRTYNTPSNIRLTVHMGVPGGGSGSWQDLGDLDTADGGSQTYVIPIPAGLANTSPLRMRLTQTKKNGKVFQQDVQFNNTTGGTGGYPGSGYYNPYYWGVPTIWIVGVVQNSQVTIQTNNFPAGVTFDVLMGPMGSNGVGGYYVGQLNSGAGGTLTASFPIPAQMAGAQKIAIRTQNTWTGYYSYNWFWNNTTNP